MRYVLDTNVLLRFLRGDHAVLSPRARELFDAASAGKCELVLTEVAIAEAVWVLSSHYKVDREILAETLSTLLGKRGVQCANTKVVLDALERFAATSCDYIDCHLAATATAAGDGVATFDRDFGKFRDVRTWKFA